MLSNEWKNIEIVTGRKVVRRIYCIFDGSPFSSRVKDEETHIVCLWSKKIQNEKRQRKDAAEQ